MHVIVCEHGADLHTKPRGMWRPTHSALDLGAETKVDLADWKVGVVALEERTNTISSVIHWRGGWCAQGCTTRVKQGKWSKIQAPNVRLPETRQETGQQRGTCMGGGSQAPRAWNFCLLFADCGWGSGHPPTQLTCPKSMTCHFQIPGPSKQLLC
jgi:hypothetical protein